MKFETPGWNSAIAQANSNKIESGFSSKTRVGVSDLGMSLFPMGNVSREKSSNFDKMKSQSKYSAKNRVLDQ